MVHLLCVSWDNLWDINKRLRRFIRFWPAVYLGRGKVKVQCVSIDAMQLHMISHPVKSVMYCNFTMCTIKMMEGLHEARLKKQGHLSIE